jgi:cytochrome c556
MTQPIFEKYNRSYLIKTTGFSRGHLSRIARGKVPLTRSFIAKACFALEEPAKKLFLPEVIAANSPSKDPVLH